MEEAIVEPGRGLFRVKASESALVLPAGPMARILALRSFAWKKARGPYPARMYRLKRKGIGLDLVGPCMGAPVAGMVLEQMIAGGAKRVIVLGFAGSISAGLKIGDLLLVNEAISDEGTSKSYYPEARSGCASEEILSKLSSVLEDSGMRFQMGRVVSTDGFFRETREKIERFQKENALAVEMEMSALYNIARFRGIEIGGMVVISDELFGERWHSGLTSPGMVLNFIRAGQVAIKVLTG